MAGKPHVLTLSYSSVLDDPRVMMEGRILQTIGYRVSVIGVALGSRPMRTNAHGMSLTIVPLVNRYRPFVIARAVWGLLRGEVESESAETRSSAYLSLLLFNLWALRLALKDRPDAIHCQEHQPLPSAWLLARLLGIKLVYDAHENTQLNRAGIGFKGALTIRIEHFFLSRVDAVITVGERLAQSLRARGARRVVVIGNWKNPVDYDVDLNEVKRLRAQLGVEHAELVVSYFGWLDPTRDIEPLLDAVAATPDVHLLIAGRGDLEARVLAASKASPNIHWLVWLPLEKVPTYTQASDVIYCCMNPSLRQLEFQMPNKLFDAFIAGKAVIARRGTGEMSELLGRYPAGVELSEVTAETVRAALLELRDPDVRATFRAQAEAGGREYNSGAAMARLRELFEDLAGAPLA